jgi:hypothetical protein
VVPLSDCFASICDGLLGVYDCVAQLRDHGSTPREISLFAYAYLAAFGLAQTLMATRMLALEHHAARVEHPEGQYLSRAL